jgi:hypothetical protein
MMMRIEKVGIGIKRILIQILTRLTRMKKKEGNKKMNVMKIVNMIWIVMIVKIRAEIVKEQIIQIV